MRGTPRNVAQRTRIRIGRTADSGDRTIPRAAEAKIGIAADDIRGLRAYRRC
jgi:hypothetical protein